ncbi:MAG: CHAT domain-containing protein, partial [Caldilineaceae bacterium]|nr:CHAT domain-containing protein [Caldilineaceae bacterium]
MQYTVAYGMGQLSLRRQRNHDARHYFQQAIEAAERLQATIGADDYKIAFRRDKMQAYEQLLTLLIRHHDPSMTAQAFQTSERARARTLLDAVERNRAASDHSRPASGASSSLADEIAAHKRALHWYYNRLHQTFSNDDSTVAEQRATITAEIATEEAQLSRLFARWRMPDLIDAPDNPTQTVTITQVQSLLPTDTLFLAYFLLETEIIVWGVTASTYWQRVLPISQSHLKELLEQLRFHMGKFHYGPAYRQRHSAQLAQSGQSILHQLYRLLIQPLADRLSESTLIIAPHGLLHYVPFHALWDGKQHWGATARISYIPSASLFHLLVTREVPPTMEPPAIFALADDRLPSIAEEVAALTTLFPDATCYVNERAKTETLLQLPSRPGFLHLATHAAFRQDNPLYSAIELS